MISVERWRLCHLLNRRIWEGAGIDGLTLSGAAYVADLRFLEGDRAAKGLRTDFEPKLRELALVRAAVRARRAAFKSALERLGSRIEAQSEKLASFETRGAPLSDRDHLDQVIQPAFGWIGDRNPKVKQLLEGSLWDPAEPETRASFTALLKELDANLARIESLRSTMPPASWRGAHRALARAAMGLVRAQYLMASIIIAADYNQAAELRERFDSSMAEATRHAGQVGQQLRLISQSPGDGPFITSDGSIDFAAAAWSGRWPLRHRERIGRVRSAATVGGRRAVGPRVEARGAIVVDLPGAT